MKDREKRLALAISENDTLPQYNEISNASSNPLSGAADTTDDGRIAVNLDSKVAQAFAKFIPIDHEDDATETFDSPPHYSQQPPWILPMNIVIQVVGSRGDVQPFVALANELQKSGHRIRIATHDVFKAFVQNAGLEFYPIGGDPAELMAYMVKNPGLIPNMETLRKGEIKRKRKMMAQMLQGCWKSCIEPDPDTDVPFVANAIIANPVSFAHVHCAEALSIPMHLVFTMPWSPTRAFPHPLANVQNTSTDPKLANYLSYGLVQALTWQGLGDVINKFRNSLDLEDLPLTEAPFIAETLKIPYTYCWSPALVPKPADWSSHIDVCGFIFRSNATQNYEPPAALTTFLNAGSPPIYIGFGSIVIDDPTSFLSKILSAVSSTGVRAIISKGWSNLSESSDENPNVFYLGDCPHEYLFQHVSAVIHHGGAGTTAAGLLAACPTLIVPFFGDQPFWGDRVAAAGAGPSPIPHKKLDSDNLAAAIQALLQPSTKLAAQAISKTMEAENGVKNAAGSIYHHLSKHALACDILPSKPAVYEVTLPAFTSPSSSFLPHSSSASSASSVSSIYPSLPSRPAARTLKVCALVAETLIKHNKIKPKYLRLYEPAPIIIENRRWDPLTSASSSAVRVSYDVLHSLNDIWYAPYKIRKEEKEARASSIATASTDYTATISTSEALNGPKEQGTSPQGDHAPKSTTNDHSSSTKAIASTSLMNLPRLTGVLTKAYLVDFPYAVTEGLRNTPRLYGEDVPHHVPITDWKSGFIVGGEEAARHLVWGSVDLFVQGYNGMKGAEIEERGKTQDHTDRDEQQKANRCTKGLLRMKGLVTGVGKGTVGTFTKLGTAGLAIWAYPAQGVWKSIYDATHGRTKKSIFSARRIHDMYYEFARKDQREEKEVLRLFEKIVGTDELG